MSITRESHSPQGIERTSVAVAIAKISKKRLSGFQVVAQKAATIGLNFRKASLGRNMHGYMFSHQVSGKEVDVEWYRSLNQASAFLSSAKAREVGGVK